MASSPSPRVRQSLAKRCQVWPSIRGTTSIATAAAMRSPSSSAGLPQSCATTRTRPTPRASRKRARNARKPSAPYGHSAGLPEAPKPGRSTAIPPARARNGRHRSAESGTPWTQRIGGSSQGASSQRTGRPSSSAVSARTVRALTPGTIWPMPPVRGRVSTPRAAWSRPSVRRVRAIRDRLRLLYGRPAAPPHGHPLDELILTVLSQSTNDRNRDVAFLRLRSRFGSWDAVREAPLAEVEDAIQPGGLHRQKSVRIQEILRALDGDDLRGLAGLPVEQARDVLTALPGVGRKTAACVLLFAFGMPDVPVDTHVSRVGTRLGLFRPGAPFEELHDALLALTPRGGALELHVNLLRHGRRTCHARRPACEECALLRLCPTGREIRAARRTSVR